MGSHNLLTKTISDLLSVDVKLLIVTPEEILSKYKIDISSNIKSSLYIINSETYLLISHVAVEETCYFLGILIEGKALKAVRQNRIFNYIAGAVSNALKDCVDNSFYNAPSVFNENLIKRMIASHIATRGHYNRFMISFLIDKMRALMPTTFEGRHFSSGLLVTKSFPLFTKNIEYNGKLLKLTDKHSLFNPINNRFWYLVDGIDSFYITGMKDFSVNFIYLTLDKKGEMQKMTPQKFLRGGDCIFRVYNGRELSVITKDEMEFIYQENVWRFRDYVGLKKIVTEDMSMADEVYDSFISYILYCSKNEISSIIWIPSDDKKEVIDRMVSTSNSFQGEAIINICDETYQGMLMRMLSSDGACVFNKDGNLLRYGCIIKTHSVRDKNKAPEQKTIGTGESAAALLAENGIAFKISQDGTIKFFHSKNEVIKF